MGLNKHKVHQMKEVLSRTGGRVSVIDKVVPYIRFIQEGEKVLVCDGGLYYENETVVPDDKIPKWFWKAWDNIDEKGKEKVGGEKLEQLRSVLSEPLPSLVLESNTVTVVTAAAVTPEEPAKPVVQPVAKKKTKKKAGKKRGRRRVMTQPDSQEAPNSESTDGITS